jgi:CopG family nickel-responsive transcriptional regulator
MSELSRVSVTIDSGLLSRFDAAMESRGYTNRSEAFRDLIRDELDREAVLDPAREVVGTVTLVYDHHVRQLAEKLTELQHQRHHTVISTLHVHLTHDTCLEVLIVRGPSEAVRLLAGQLIAAKGVRHGQFALTSAGSGRETACGPSG